MGRRLPEIVPHATGDRRAPTAPRSSRGARSRATRRRAIAPGRMRARRRGSRRARSRGGRDDRRTARRRMIQCEQSMLIWQSALEISGLVRAKKLSPIEVTDAVLSRIDAITPVLNAFCVVAAEQARAAAREAEIAVTKGEPLGPLHGVPVSIKDVLFTRGLTTTGGSRLFADHVPDEDAIAVARLRAAGALVLGKTNTSEFGHKAVTENPLFGVTRSPWNPALTPGGSSGGAAVGVASGCGTPAPPPRSSSRSAATSKSSTRAGRIRRSSSGP